MTVQGRVKIVSFAVLRRVLLAALLVSAGASARAATVTVTTNADDLTPNDGNVSLREAITAINAGNDLGDPDITAQNPGAFGVNDAIHFAIPGSGAHTITLTTVLPDVTAKVTIDGYTQPGSSANTVAVGDNAVLTIVLNVNGLNLGIRFQSGASNSTVRGLVVNNIFISGFAIVVSADNVAVEGNFIGTDAAGAVAVPVDVGVLINGGSNARIGGTAPAQRNLISGNFRIGLNGVGIDVQLGGGGTLIQGNYIGTNAAGTASLGNTVGILVNPVGATTIGDITIGGTAPGAGNLISGQVTDVGINLVGSSTGAIGTVTIQGNIIGLDATGTASLPNGNGGIANQGSGTRGMTLVGGTTAAARNIISGGPSIIKDGITNSGSDTSLVIQGNYIGTDITGTVALGNGAHGVSVFGLGSVVIGGPAAGAGNVISGNGRDGIHISNGSATIQGNFIGTQADGVTPLTNGTTAIFVSRSPQTVIGGVLSGDANRIVHIANNLGIDVEGTPSLATIRGNSIRADGAATFLGIDLNGDGITPNDACDADTGGPNNFQNFPVITSAVLSAGNVTISGTLNSVANTTFALDFFSNVACSPLGNGEGLTFLGSRPVTTDGTCNGPFSVVLPIPAGQTIITATATDPSGDTSEFSACLTVAGAPPTPSPTTTPALTPTPTPVGPTATPTPTPIAGVPAAVPTLSPPLLLLLALALAAVAVLLMRRIG